MNKIQKTVSLKTFRATILLLLVLAALLAVVTFNISRAGYVGDETEQWYTPSQESTYIVGQYNSSHFYMRNHTGHGYSAYEGYEFLNSNQTLVEQYALGNMTTGLLYLKEILHNTSLSISASQMVQQQYINKTTFFTSTGSSSIPDCPVSTSGTFTLTSDTTEHTIVTLTPTSVEQVTNFYLDLSELTQNCTLRVYLKIDGVNYVELTGMTVTVAAGSKGMPLKDHVIDTAWKVTIQSAVAEGASRNIDYRYFVNVY